MKQKPAIGIIGGMGPYASMHFYQLLLQKSNTVYGIKNNDEYPEIFIDSLPIPDFISDTSKLPQAKDMLLDRAKKLHTLGCSSIGMVCNTAHILSQELKDVTQGVFLSMIDLVSKRAEEKEYKRVGIIATATTVKMKLYEKSLQKFNIESVYATDEIQKVHEDIIRELIAGKKHSKHEEYLCKMTHEFIKEHTLDAIILGCTELPLVFPKDHFGNVIDCMDVLADELLKQYYSN